MSLQVVGAGLGRTGTNSLKLALERLLGGRVHHMVEVFQDADRQLPLWQGAVEGRPYEAWAPALDGFVASVDWPSCRWYERLASENSQALVLLSQRSDADEWWGSANRTIFQHARSSPPDAPGMAVIRPLITDHIGSFEDEAVAKAGYERHNAEVRQRIAPERLLEWQPQDGWGPICERLGLPVPAEPFPHTNTSDEFRSRFGWD